MEKKILIGFIAILLNLSFLTTVFAKEGKVLPFEELFEKFSSVSDKICMESAIQAATMGYEVPEAEKEKIKDELQDTADRASLEVIEQFRNAFIVSDSEAKEILSGQHETDKNRQDIKSCIEEFKKMMIELPISIRYLIVKYNEGSLSDFEIEFTARLFKEFLKQTYDKLDKQFK